MTDKFSAHYETLVSSATRHAIIAIDDNNDIPEWPKAFYVNTGGVAVIRDRHGTDVSYNVVAGTTVPFRPARLLTGTTAEIVGLD